MKLDTNTQIEDWKDIKGLYQVSDMGRVKSFGRTVVSKNGLKQYTREGKLIKVWQSTNEAQRKLGFAKQNISAVARGKRKTAYGYVWKYIEEEKRKESSLLLRGKNY